MKKLAVIFPGVGYTLDRPLLHYAREIVRKYDYEIRTVSYTGFPSDVFGDADKMNKCFEIAFNKAKDDVADIDFENYDEVLFIGKSVGTAVACALAGEKSLKVRSVLFTPVVQTFRNIPGETIVFHGTSDHWAASETIKKLCEENDAEVNIIPDANHSLETGDISRDITVMRSVMKKVDEFVSGTGNGNLLQAINPYMPSWEYVPDGEPYVFGDRVYVYGSHDKFRGDVYCMLDYICYSAPVNDLGNWRYEGVIFKKTQDPDNADGSGMLYAPDVAKGPDGRYYLYYAINTKNHISVAVCDEPAGKYEFYGYVHYANGDRLGDRAIDEMQFDPGVLFEDGKVYLYTGFCPVGQKDRHGAMMSVLSDDMVTIIEEPIFVAPSEPYTTGDISEYRRGIAEGSLHNSAFVENEGSPDSSLRAGFKGHEFFEAPSIRKIKGKYYFIYSSVLFHELCYAVSDNPRGPFRYKGVIISNGDLHIDTYKDGEKCAFYCSNNHGSIEKIGDDYYIFYHRHTNGTNYSRQACFEKLMIDEDGTIKQAMMTSCCSIKPLKGQGVYPAYIACNLFNEQDETYIPWIGWMDDKYPKITQDGADGDENLAIITNMRDGATAGFKYFDVKGLKKIAITTKGYGRGVMELRTQNGGEVIGTIPTLEDNVWVKRETEVSIPDGVYDLYITYRGTAWCGIREIEFIC